MKYVLSLVLALILSFLFGCSPSAECLVSDAVYPLNSIKMNENERVVYLRVTGLGEKEHFYELYSMQPEFDVCGAPDIPPISQVHVDSTIGKPQTLLIVGKQLKLQYVEGVIHFEALKSIEIQVK